MSARELTRALTLLEDHGRIHRSERVAPSGKGRPATVYHATSAQTCEGSEGIGRRYLSASNGAAKPTSFSCEGMRGKMRSNSPEPGHQSDQSAEGIQPAEAPAPGGCLHEHLNDAGHCNDCGELVSEVGPPLEAPTASQGEQEGTEQTEGAAPAPRGKPPLRHVKKGRL